MKTDLPSFRILIWMIDTYVLPKQLLRAWYRNISRFYELKYDNSNILRKKENFGLLQTILWSYYPELFYGSIFRYLLS